MKQIKVKIDGKEHDVQVEETADGRMRAYYGGEVFDINVPKDSEIPSFELTKKKGIVGKGELIAPLPGIIMSILVKRGEDVKKGQVLLKIVSMKMENEIISQTNGKIREIKVKKGATVNKGDVLILID